MAQPLEYKTTSAGERRAVHVHAVRLAAATILLAFNILSIATATAWAVYVWREFLASRGWLTLAPALWLAGSAVLALVQIVLSLIPTCIVARRNTSLPAWLTVAVRLAAVAGLLITVGSVVGLFVYDRLVPAPHHPGL